MYIYKKSLKGKVRVKILYFGSRAFTYWILYLDLGEKFLFAKKFRIAGKFLIVA